MSEDGTASVLPPGTSAPAGSAGGARPAGGPAPRRGLVGPFTGRQILVAAAIVAAVAVTLSALTTPLGPASPVAPRPGSSFVPFASAVAGLQPGAPAPELVGSDHGRTVQLTDLEGRPISLAALRGRPVWINFFATWCPPCQSETPTIEQVYEEHRAEGLAVIGVSVQESSVGDVAAYAKTYGLQYTIGFDATSAIYHAYHVYGLPTQVFIDRAGIVRQVWNGPLSQLEAEQMLAPLLGQPAASSPAAAASPAAGG